MGRQTFIEQPTTTDADGKQSETQKLSVWELSRLKSQINADQSKQAGEAALKYNFMLRWHLFNEASLDIICLS